MTRNKAYLVEYQDNNGGPVAFGGIKFQITGKGKIITGKLDFEDVYFVKELKQFNLFSVSQMCDKKNKVLFTDSECLVLSPDFKLPDENQVLLRVPRQNNMYSFNLKNIVPTGGLACLIAKATVDESNKWHRRLGHVNFKNLNKLVKGNLVRGLPSKIFQNDHTCVACQKGKQHKASWKGPNWLFNLDYLTDSMNYQHVTAEYKANKTAGPKEANHSAVKSSEAKNGDEKPNGDTGPKTNEEPKDQEDQAFLEELERLKRQENEANDAARAFRKEFAQCTEDLLLQAGVARATSTNTVNTVSTPISTASPSRIFSANPTSAVQTRSKVKKSYRVHAFIEPKKISQALEDESWKAIGTKWVYIYKNNERGVVVRNKARIEAIGIFLAFASYMGFIVYQMDVKSAFLYGTINEEVYVSQPPGFVDPKFPKKVYKVVKALYGLHQAPRAWYATLSTFLLKNGYKRGTIDKTLFIKKDRNDVMLVQMSSMGDLTFFLGLQVQQKEDGIFISQDKYVAEILKKFDFANVKSASTLIETQKPLNKDEEVDDVDVHLYRSMIGSLMYLTASRPDIMYAVCACSRFQVTPKTSHLHAVKRIFRYLKGKPKLVLWYPRVSSFDLEAYSDSDYARENLDRKSTTGEAEYVAAANCCGTICIVKNPVFHSKTKNIEIRHHFIRDAYEKKLIQKKLQAEWKGKDRDEEHSSMEYMQTYMNEVQGEKNSDADQCTLAVRLTHEGRFKHSQLNKRTLEEIQALYIKEQERAINFVPYMEPNNTKVKVKLEEAEQGTKKTPGKIVKIKARKKARKQTHVDTDNEHDSEEDERKIESMNKDVAGESNDKVSNVSKKRKGGPRMNRAMIVESTSDGAYDLLRFIQKQIDEAGSHDGGEKDLKVLVSSPHNK
ncbi:putative ribonuclease H-like domain-containing protein [Tanacetum coccineum]